MNKLDFAGRNAIVTGGAQGIGAAIVQRLRASGAKVIIWDLDGTPKVDVSNADSVQAAAERAAKELGKIDVLVNNAGIAGPSMPVIDYPIDEWKRVLDVTDEKAIQKMAAEAGDVDVLFNCAGIVHHGSILDAKPGDWDQAFAVNVKSMYLVSRAFLPGMLKKGRGSIINMASVASSLKGLPNRFVYGASKAAVIGLTKSIAADYVGKGVRCNAICPGTVDTPSLQGRINAFADPVQARKDFVARQPMGRLGTVDDIMGILVFLASDESLFATGNAYSIDGGMTI